MSLNSVVGIENPKTMKLKGVINGQDVVVMIDLGATHNFISLKTVEKLQIPTVVTKEFGVSSEMEKRGVVDAKESNSMWWSNR